MKFRSSLWVSMALILCLTSLLAPTALAATVTGLTVTDQQPPQINPTGKATYSISLSRSGTSSTQATLSIVGELPAGATATFNPNSFDLGTNTTSTLSIQTTGATPPGSYAFQVQAIAGATVVSSVRYLSVVNGPASQLVFTQQPSDAATGAFISPSVTVEFRDQWGYPVPIGNAISLAIKIGTGTSGATLRGSTTRPASNGVATFGDLNIDRAGVGYVLSATTDKAGVASTASSPFNIKASTSTSITTNLGTATVAGQPYAVNYSVTSPSGGTPTGAVTVSDGSDSCTATVADGGCTLTSTTAGTKTVRAYYAGSASFGSSSSTNYSHTVSRAGTATLLSSSPHPSLVGGPVTFTATVSALAPGSGTPTGAVAFRSAGSTIPGCAAQSLNGSGVATCATSLPAKGQFAIGATYSDDSNFTSSATTGYHWVANTTRAVISLLNAYSQGGRVFVRWETISEAGTAGFYLYRQDLNTGEFLPVQRELIPGLFNSRTGGSYRLLDPAAVPGASYVYKLIELEHDGTRIDAGTVRVAAEPEQPLTSQEGAPRAAPSEMISILAAST